MIGCAILTDILFIGMGLFGADMPQMIASAGRMNGAETTVEARQAPEAPLAYHWVNAAAGPGVDPRAVLSTGGIDQLVMTEALPLTESLVRHDSIEYATDFCDLAVRRNPQAECLLYESWPPLDGRDPKGWREEVAAAAPLWQAIVQALNDQGFADGDHPPARLIPLARGLLALDGAIAAGQVPGLVSITQIFAEDGRRLNGRGSYFAAMLFHAALSGDDPQGLPVWLGRNRPATLEDAVTEPMAGAMQRIALRVVQDRMAAASVDRVMWRQAKALVDSTISDDRGFVSWQGPTDSYLSGVEREGIAFNLTGISDWSANLPFLDVFKNARPWIGHLPGQWGGFDAPKLREAGYLDEHGWPKRIPDEVTHLTTLILSDLDSGMISAAGRYVLRYRGVGRIELEGRLARNISYEEGRIAFDYLPGRGSVLIHLRRTDPEDPIRDISVVRQDRLALADAGQIFNPDFLARLRGAELLRFMDWMRTNNSTMTSPDQIPAREDYIWSTDRGVPPEVMVALANELDADPWFTIPHLASDDLVRQYARRVRDNLAPGRRAWVEFSNEIWNWSFDQRAWADRKAAELWGVEDAGMQYGAFRAAQVVDIWTEEFAPSASARLVRVVGTFTGWTGTEDAMLNAPAWKAADPEGWEPLSEHFDAYAITGYFHANLENPERMEMLRSLLEVSHDDAVRRAGLQGLVGADLEAFIRAHRFDLAIDRMIAELRDGAISGDPEGSVRWVIDNLFRHHRRAAARFGLDLVMYEGGSHVVATGPAADDEELTEFLIALNYSPGMGDLYLDLIEGWQRFSDQPFNFYTAIGGPSQYGSWGVLRHLDDENPRWDAVSESYP
ncbi:hypothetical protein MU516_03580 [Paracoccus sp. YLB-12]|uniref:Cellulose-binding protein n=1 Tax=Paracoccus maritimus TaxID=2933292 RepID=A0ABT2K7J0_9RHOB|nr:hypothetical protein [Paracoccus sp. YLB-12]MCT4331949.1 hypothetical protein [Paracoccus sp. YLB-12]